MAFVNPLAVSLLAAGSSVLLMALFAFYTARKQKSDELAVPAFVFGAFDLIAGLFIELTWPLPGPYNVLFGDPLLFLGLLMLSGGYMLYRKISLKALAPIAFLFGIYLLDEAYSVYTLGLTNSPLLTTALYGSGGLAGIFAIFSRLKNAKLQRYAYYLAALFLAIAMLIFLFYAYGAVMGHISSLATAH